LIFLFQEVKDEVLPRSCFYFFKYLLINIIGTSENYSLSKFFSIVGFSLQISLGGNMENFKDKIVLVTGAASGIGRATAIAFAKEGAKVAVSDIMEHEAIETVKMIEKINGSAIFVGCEVANEGNVKAMVKSVIDKWGRLDCAFNNAGTEGTPAQTTECTVENWDKTVNTDLKGVWLCMKYEIPEMLKAGSGTIVNCSSIAGLVGFQTIPAYVASKHGVIGLTETAALEYGKENIRVNAVCPGPIRTPMLTRFTQGDESQFKAGDPMGRVGEPEEIAEAVLWLCSNKSSYVTGQALAVDGGWVSQ
jgi:NAD(P)-dependent dehydrogenase (short-subunit alcohol dehydrogenase family)